MSFGQRNFDRQKPEIDFPEGDVPTELVITDLIEGDGAEAKAGDTVSTHYVGVAWSTGEEFDASWGRGAPLDFRVGVGQVIQGWDQGLLGMKVGGRRRLEIPSGTGLRLPRRRRGDRPQRGPDLRCGPGRRPLTDAILTPEGAVTIGVSSSGCCRAFCFLPPRL